MQIQFGREFAPSEADGGPPLICQGLCWQSSSPPRCNRRVDSWDDDSVTADQSNLCGQRTSINAVDDAEDTNNDAAKAKAKADKEVGGGDAEVSD